MLTLELVKIVAVLAHNEVTGTSASHTVKRIASRLSHKKHSSMDAEVCFQAHNGVQKAIREAHAINSATTEGEKR